MPIEPAELDLSADGPAYEVMFLLDAEDSAIPTLEQRLGGLGDSLVVVGGDGLWNVHVHVDDVGAAIEAGIEAGRPYRVRVTHFAEQLSQARPPAGAASLRTAIRSSAESSRSARVRDCWSCSARPGPERCRVARDDVARPVRSSPPSTRPVAPRSSCCRTTRTASRPPRPPAQAARDEGIRAAVIPTRAQVQGLAAIAVHDAGAGVRRRRRPDDLGRRARPPRRGHDRRPGRDDDGRTVSRAATASASSKETSPWSATTSVPTAVEVVDAAAQRRR